MQHIIIQEEPVKQIAGLQEVIKHMQLVVEQDLLLVVLIIMVLLVMVAVVAVVLTNLMQIQALMVERGQ